ncbi:MAG: hypothetical protein NC427_05110 [Ruminococcus flavefaciens]|nr:hypothetical protein [Ruminococcus flavefaciens]
MRRETISEGVGNIDNRYIQEAADYAVGEEGVLRRSADYAAEEEGVLPRSADSVAEEGEIFRESTVCDIGEREPFQKNADNVAGGERIVSENTDSFSGKVGILRGSTDCPAGKKLRRPSGFFRRRALLVSAAAALVLCVAVYGILALTSPDRSTVRVYARETDEEITSAGAVLRSGSISDSGEMKGHPLMFYLTGENIASVRFSCKNQQLNFMDWTEKRDEYGKAQNFTVDYGEEESEYYYLTIDWVPDKIIRELTDHADSGIATLPEELRNDVIVLEITFEGGKTSTKAITVSLREDGMFYAALGDYRIREEDDFVRRPDSEAIPREIQYAQGAEVANGGNEDETLSGCFAADVPLMVFVSGRLYQRSPDQKEPYDGPEDEFVYLGEIKSDITAEAGAGDGTEGDAAREPEGAATGEPERGDPGEGKGDAAGGSVESVTNGVPLEEFQANHPIVGAEVYQYGADLMLRIQGEYWLYEAAGEGAVEVRDDLSEEEKMMLDPNYRGEESEE